jgi:hypothetical protein
MVMDKLDFLFQKIASKEEFACLAEGVSISEIDALEAKLGVVFPDDYRRFLKRFGHASWFGHALVGISPTDLDYDTESRTFRMRHAKIPQGFHPVPLEGNIVKKYDGGGYYFLYSATSPKAGRVVLFTDDEAGGPSEEWHSFTDFLEYVTEL